MFKTNKSDKMGTTAADRKENTSVKIVDGGLNLFSAARGGCTPGC